MKSVKIMLLAIYFLVLAGICVIFMGGNSALGAGGAAVCFLISLYLIVKGLIKRD